VAFIEMASAWLEDRKMSRSLLTGLLLLSSLPPDGSFTTNSELARKLGISPSTCHRYLRTLVEVGLVERDHHKRHYRRVLVEAGEVGPRSASPTRINEIAHGKRTMTMGLSPADDGLVRLCERGSW
jgi:DNA-binding MarR family transcriptional regulator